MAKVKKLSALPVELDGRTQLVLFTEFFPPDDSEYSVDAMDYDIVDRSEVPVHYGDQRPDRCLKLYLKLNGKVRHEFFALPLEYEQWLEELEGDDDRDLMVFHDLDDFVNSLVEQR